MHRRPLVVALLISIAFLLFFSHLYITWEISQNTFTEFPGPRISGLFPASNVNQSENFNLYGSSIELTAFANITYNASIPANSNTTVVPILSIEILRVSYNNIAVPIERVTFQKHACRKNAVAAQHQVPKNGCAKNMILCFYPASVNVFCCKN